MSQRDVDLFINRVKEKYGVDSVESNVEAGPGEDFKAHGGFSIEDGKYLYIYMSTETYSFMSVEYRVLIQHKSTAIQLYKAANNVNNTCPGLKCVIDKYSTKDVHLSFSMETSSKGDLNINGLVDGLDILPTGGVFFLDSLK